MVLGKELSISTSGKSSDRTNVRKIEFQSSIANSHTPGPMVGSAVSGVKDGIIMVFLCS
jgi:hypothetical protein